MDTWVCMSLFWLTRCLAARRNSPLQGRSLGVWWGLPPFASSIFQLCLRPTAIALTGTRQRHEQAAACLTTEAALLRSAVAPVELRPKLNSFLHTLGTSSMEHSMYVRHVQPF